MQNQSDLIYCIWHLMTTDVKQLYLVDVPFLVSQIAHLNASALFLYVQTEQSHNAPSISSNDLGFFGLKVKSTAWNLCSVRSFNLCHNLWNFIAKDLLTKTKNKKLAFWHGFFLFYSLSNFLFYSCALLYMVHVWVNTLA